MFVRRPSYPRLTNASKGGYLVEDAFHFQPEVDPLDHRFEASHMMILDRMPTATSDYSFQAVNDSAAFPAYSPQAPIYGNEVSQPSGYREFMRPQSIPLWPCNGVCPQPTNSPSGPICDHTTCNPPPDVGFLSRRFAENGNWIRARASAVASLAYKRRGCKSPQATVKRTAKLTEVLCYSLLVTNRHCGNDSWGVSYPQSTDKPRVWGGYPPISLPPRSDQGLGSHLHAPQGDIPRTFLEYQGHFDTNTTQVSFTARNTPSFRTSP